MENYGLKLRERREARGVTIGELAEKADTASLFVADMEEGRMVCASETTLEGIAEALETTVEDLFGEAAPMLLAKRSRQVTDIVAKLDSLPDHKLNFVYAFVCMNE